MLSLSAGAVLARAAGPVALDPAIADLGTAVVVAADGSVLSSNGAAPSSITIALARGVRVDTASRKQLCTKSQASRGACPAASSIGFGRYVVAVSGFLLPGGQTDVTWWLDAFLGKPAQRGDAASVVLLASLLSAASVNQLLVPALGAPVPARSTTIARLRRTSGTYGVELRVPGLPIQLHVPPGVTAAPSRLELSLSAVRQVKQAFVHTIKVRTLNGYEVRKVRDHRLVGHDLLRTPARCSGSWPLELRVAFGATTRRTRGSVACAAAISAAPSAVRRRGGSSRR